jgi:hypothetical protein
MIDYMNHRLVCWAEWAVRRDAGAQGFPRQSHYTKAVLSHSRGSIEEINEAAMEVETCYLALRHARAPLADAVFEFYRKTGSAEYKAKKLGVCRDTLYGRLHQAQVWMMEWLQDQEVERHASYGRENKFYATC